MRPAARASVAVTSLERHADDGALDLAELDQIVHHLLGERDRNREAVAGVVAGAAGDRAVDADDVAADVEQRTAGVARIDRRVRLDVVGDRVRIVAARIEQRRLIAALGADDARRDREVELQRIADRQHPLADARLGVVAERQRREILRRRS